MKPEFRGAVWAFYNTGDTLRVRWKAGVVKYRQNGTVVYTSTVAPTYPLLVDTSLYTNGSTLTNVVLSSGSGSAAADIEWLVTDQLGTPRMIFDKMGSLANTKRHDYLPFGEELIAGQGLRTTTLGYLADNMRQKFTSKQRDNETGLDYFGARYYASVQGRFTSPDAPFADQFAENPQSWNLYSYVRNIPLIMIDPTGRRTGDYYYRDGTWAYTDNLRDDKVYVLNETTEGDGSVNLTPRLLGKTHTQFRIIANIVRQEAGTSDAEENLWIAHTSNNEASATHVSLYDLLQSRFSSAGDKTSGIATTDSSVRANSARAGVIDVLAGAMTRLAGRGVGTARTF